jgi:four helix bundle protein
MTQGDKSQVYPEHDVDDALSLREEPAKQIEGRRYDLAERTAKFGETIIVFARRLAVDTVSRPLINQIVRSGTSVGANYCEADDAVSKKEFRQKIGTCRKEAKETKYWLRMIATACPDHRHDARDLWREAKELHLIFCAILRK